MKNFRSWLAYCYFIFPFFTLRLFLLFRLYRRVSRWYMLWILIWRRRAKLKRLQINKIRNINIYNLSSIYNIINQVTCHAVSCVSVWLAVCCTLYNCPFYNISHIHIYEYIGVWLLNFFLMNNVLNYLMN